MAAETAAQAQRKRTLDTIERRFAAEKAVKLHQQQTRDDKRRRTTEGSKLSISSSSRAAASPMRAPITPSTNPSLEKDEESGPAYLKLSHPIHDNLLPTIDKFSDKRGSIVDKVANELLQHGDCAQKYMQGSRSMKIDNYILLDNYVQGRSSSKGSYIRALKTQSKRSKKHMSMKQHKKLGSFDLPKDIVKFEKFKPMHEMWTNYIMQLIKVSGKNQLGQCFLSADLHGAMISVAECKITALTGVSGIMIRETAETFGIVTPDDKFKVVPKKNSVFIFQVDCWKVTLLGEKLTSRNIGS
jgi:ribonuclease P protein subunit POP4